jgi:hypothetical protein
VETIGLVTRYPPRPHKRHRAGPGASTQLPACHSPNPRWVVARRRAGGHTKLGASTPADALSDVNEVRHLHAVPGATGAGAGDTLHRARPRRVYGDRLCAMSHAVDDDGPILNRGTQRKTGGSVLGPAPASNGTAAGRRHHPGARRARRVPDGASVGVGPTDLLPS